MAEQQLNTIVVNPRTINIGGDILAIAAIARMRVVEYKDVRGYSPGSKLLLNLSLGSFILGLILAGISFSGSEMGNTLATVGALVAIAVAIYATTGPMRRILVIEMSSGGRSILGARQIKPLEYLKHTITNVIENPPSGPSEVQIETVNMVDLRNSRGVQIGDSNTQNNV